MLQQYTKSFSYNLPTKETLCKNNNVIISILKILNFISIWILEAISLVFYNSK